MISTNKDALFLEGTDAFWVVKIGSAQIPQQGADKALFGETCVTGAGGGGTTDRN